MELEVSFFTLRECKLQAFGRRWKRSKCTKGCCRKSPVLFRMTDWTSITAARETAPLSCCFTRNSYKFLNYWPVRYVTGCLPKISVSSCSSFKIPLSLLPKWISPGDLRHENVRSWDFGGKEEKYTAVLSVAVSDKRLKTSNFLCSLPSQETQHWASSLLSLPLPIRPGASRKEKSYSKWEPNTKKLWYLNLINLPKTFPLLALLAGFPQHKTTQDVRTNENWWRKASMLLMKSVTV